VLMKSLEAKERPEADPAAHSTARDKRALQTAQRPDSKTRGSGGGGWGGGREAGTCHACTTDPIQPRDDGNTQPHRYLTTRSAKGARPNDERDIGAAQAPHPSQRVSRHRWPPPYRREHVR
jgi:hypothetical protein